MISKIVVFGNKNTTLSLVKNFCKKNLKPACVVTLGNNKKQSSGISGADFSLEDYCRNASIDVFSPQKYKLDEEDLKFFLKGHFDLGICAGWQRLIPSEVLDCFKHGVYGWHGSMFRFPDGRGRSPINWSMRLGAKNIYHNFFKYNSEADAGCVFETESIPIEPTELVEDVIKKATEHMCRSSVRLIKSLETDTVKLLAQPKGATVFFNKLTERDGFLQPSLMTKMRCTNIIRATSRPFPGAYLRHKRKTVLKIWNASICKNTELKPGCVFFDEIGFYFGALDGPVFTEDYDLIDPGFSELKGKIFKLI